MFNENMTTGIKYIVDIKWMIHCLATKVKSTNGIDSFNICLALSDGLSRESIIPLMLSTQVGISCSSKYLYEANASFDFGNSILSTGQAFEKTETIFEKYN